MSHSWWLPTLKDRELGTGLPEQIKAWSDLFQIRAIGAMEGRVFYISMKNGPYKVEGTPEFREWTEAKSYLAENWTKLYDEIFEKEILGGSEGNQADHVTED